VSGIRIMVDKKKIGTDSQYHQVAIGLGMASTGSILILAPAYLETSSGYSVPFHLFGSFLGLIGVSIALSELGKLRGRAQVGNDISIALFMTGMAATIFVLERRSSLTGWAARSVRVAALLSILLAPTFFFTGLAAVADTSPSNKDEKTRSRGEKTTLAITSVLTGLLSLATAVVGLLEAIGGDPNP
jgi:hypothetical protein